MTYEHTDFDAAFDFAQRNRRGIKFCDEMMRFFETRGRLTPNQVAALLRIRDRSGL